MSVAVAARRAKDSETSVGNETSVGKWKQRFFEAGRAGLTPVVRLGPSSRGAAPAADVEGLKTALISR